MRTRRLAVLAVALVAALTVAPTNSARVVEVRVGNHPTFTRVVFELDGRAGYRIERREHGGAPELVVTLDAASVPREIKVRGPMVEGVSVEPAGEGAVAHVRLRRAVPLVKEMLLASPSRIVLDLVVPEELAAKGKAKPSEAPAPAPALAEKPAVEEKVAVETPAPAPKKPEAAPAPKPVPTPEVTAKAPAPGAPAKPVEVAKPAELPKPPKPVEVAKPAEPVEPPKPADAAKAPKPVELAESEKPAEAAAPAEPAKPAEPAAQPAPAEVPKVAQAPEPPPKRPVPAPPVASQPKSGAVPRWSGSDPVLTLGIVAVAALVFALVVARVLRRRASKPTPLDVLESARTAGAPPLAEEEEEGFGGFERTTGEPEGGFAPARGRAAEPARTPGAAPAPPVSGPGLFDEDAEKETQMEMGAGLSIEREPATRPAPIPFGTAAGSDLEALVRQLEMRVGQLESRLEEAAAARERLERQVAAQSEELRVQRAAIARTQRALRGMTRVGEEQATEPALRDPSKPTSRP